jgi:pilus assembly protein TadC
MITNTLLLIAVLQGLAISTSAWLERTESRTAKLLFSALITSFSLTLLNSLLDRLDFFTNYPKLYFVPIYFTHAFGPLLFFYTKSSLYPQFRLHLRDLKHFLLPIAQSSFFFFTFFNSPSQKEWLWRNDYSLLYGTFAYPLYVFSFTVYSYFAYRFVRHRIRSIPHIELTALQQRSIFRLKEMLKILYFLLLINTYIIVLHFCLYQFFSINLYNSHLYVVVKDLSFAVMIFWIGLYGYRKLIRDRVGV